MTAELRTGGVLPVAALARTIQSPGQQAHLEAERDWAMAPFPVPESASNHTVMSTRFLAIPAGAPNADAALEDAARQMQVFLNE